MSDIILGVGRLMEETGAKPIDLVRAGLSQATAYRLAKDEIVAGIESRTLAVLCDFFSARLNRKIGPGDILLYNP